MSRSPDSSWKIVLERINIAKKNAGINESTTTINGIDFFGLSYPEVSYCIEGLEGADRCKDYICRKLRDSDASMYYSQYPVKRELGFNTPMYNIKRMK